MKNSCFILLLITTLLGCSNQGEDPSEINIRLSNKSDLDYKHIIVNTTTGNVDFGDLNSGQLSEYKTFQTAYRYAFVELEIDGETYTIQPIDYVGETPLKNGDYTYQIDANDSLDRFGKLSLTLLKE